jgi:hypothetical protein|tara:strand:+ start:1500 stop:2108 length:609 start_codon:yes stop_codon:yes gene_type:complete
MTDYMALDIETSNYSWEIGGWGNKALFDTTVVATWDGKDATVFSKQDLDIDGLEVLPLHPRVLGDHITDFVEKGGKILGHNILNFDFPVLKESLDCWAVGDVMQKADSIFDTKTMFQKASLAHGNLESSLNILSKHNLNQSKLMQSIEAPEAWAEGRYEDVIKYCVSDAQLTYDLFMLGRDTGIIKSRSLKTGEIIEVEVEW